MYIKEKDLELGIGLDICDPERDYILLVASTFGITGYSDADIKASKKSIEQQIAFYGSSYAYKTIFESKNE